MKLSVAASCLLSLPIPTAMASTAKATKANTSPHTANTSPNNIVHSEYFLGPVSCPKHCASGANFGGILAADNVQQCNPDDKYQRWLIHQVNDGGGEVIKAESPENAGRCLGVAAHGGDDDDMLGGAIAPSPNEDTCNGQLALVDCQHPSAEWLSSGAHLYSAPCWTQGHSAALTVNEDCTSLGLSLAGNGAPTPITRAQSFMLLEPSFIETIVDDPQPVDGGGGGLGAVGPEPPTLKRCGESFTNEKVVLSKDLDCGGPVEGVPRQLCAVTLSGPDAELNCNDNKLSQEASAPIYDDGPFRNGICLKNRAKVINCNVQRFVTGIDLYWKGGEVKKSDLSFNYFGMYAYFARDRHSPIATVTIEDTQASNNENTGLFIYVDPSANGYVTNAEVIVKGQVAVNSNGENGIFTYLNSYSNSNLEINVESGATLNSCGNKGADIGGNVVGNGMGTATAKFLGEGYICEQDKVNFSGEFTAGITPPVCQPCPTLTRCGESFTNETMLVVLSEDLNCGPLVDPQQDCAVTLDGPLAELNCGGNTLSQEANMVAPYYDDGQFHSGICLRNGAKAINCNVQRFRWGIEIDVSQGGEVVKSVLNGIPVRNGGSEVVNSHLSFNVFGIHYSITTGNSTLTIENTHASYNQGYGLYISVSGYNADAKLIVKGNNTFNSNRSYGIYTYNDPDTNLGINVEDGSLNSCENGSSDIWCLVYKRATLNFLGDGYTCAQNRVVFKDYSDSTSNVVKPTCQACP